MGLIGQPHHPEVQAVVDESLRKIVAAGRTAGALVSNETAAHHLEQGVRFFLGGPAPWIESGLIEMNRRAEA
jgi:4-hydroxy-2-oxoheptanedioate aldolase